MSRNLLEGIKSTHIKTKEMPMTIGITQEEFLEYRAQKRVINELCNFIEKVGYTVNRNEDWIIIEEQAKLTPYKENVQWTKQ